METGTPEAVTEVAVTQPVTPTVEALQAELAALKAKEASLAAKEGKPAKAKTKAKAPKAKAKAKAPKVETEDCTFDGCENKQIAKGLCPSHYRQMSRGVKLKPLRVIGRGLVRLPMVIRVEQETFKALKQRIKQGKANSMYDATRQALEAGIAGWSKE